MQHKRLSIRSDLGQLKTVREAVQEMAGSCLQAQAHLIVLAVDEAVSNVMRHGAGTADSGPLSCVSNTAPGAGQIDIDIGIDTDSGTGARRLEIAITHCGPQYDPSQALCDDPAARVLRRQRGGMGISIMRRVMDEVRYTHSAGQRNDLRLIKYIDRGVATD